MGKRFDETNVYEDQIIDFTYNGEEHTWKGDYGVRQFGEYADWDYPGDQETEITILDTEYIETWSEEQENWIKIEPTDDMLSEIKWEIEKKL